MKNRYGSRFPSLDTVLSGVILVAAAIRGVALGFDPSFLLSLT